MRFKLDAGGTRFPHSRLLVLQQFERCGHKPPIAVIPLFLLFHKLFADIISLFLDTGSCLESATRYSLMGSLLFVSFPVINSNQIRQKIIALSCLTRTMECELPSRVQRIGTKHWRAAFDEVYDIQARGAEGLPRR